VFVLRIGNSRCGAKRSIDNPFCQEKRINEKTIIE
jgi:hypothetical protein